VDEDQEFVHHSTPSLVSHLHDPFLGEIALVAHDLLAVPVIENLCRDGSNAESVGLAGVLPDVDEDDGGAALVLLGQGLDDRDHHLARDAGLGTDVDHGDHALDGHFLRVAGDERGLGRHGVAGGGEKKDREKDAYRNHEEPRKQC
jgi:hypothetical protein